MCGMKNIFYTKNLKGFLILNPDLACWLVTFLERQFIEINFMAFHDRSRMTIMQRKQILS